MDSKVLFWTIEFIYFFLKSFRSFGRDRLEPLT